MISQTLAKDDRVAHPIGHQLTIGDREQVEIAGVVTDALFDDPNRDPHPRYLFLSEQQCSIRRGSRPSSATEATSGRSRRW